METSMLGEPDWRQTGTCLLAAETKPGADQRASLSVVAIKYGLAARIPTEAELAAWGVTLGGFPSPRAEPEGEQARVAGTLEFDEAKPGWVGSWRMRWRGADYAWGISGVNFDQAFLALIRGVIRVAPGHGPPD
jgi:hypothetical protein